MRHFPHSCKSLPFAVLQTLGIIFMLSVSGCGSTLIGVMDDRTAIGVRDTTAQDGFPAKTIECKVMDTCDDLALKLCPQGFDIVRSITQKNDGTFTATIRCK